MILFDAKHSSVEKRYFCIGKTAAGGIATVRFTLRNGHIRIIGAGYWRKGKKIYGRTVNYTDAPVDVDESLDEATIVADLLPSPDQLIRKTEKKKLLLPSTNTVSSSLSNMLRSMTLNIRPWINGVVSSYAEKFLSKK